MFIGENTEKDDRRTRVAPCRGCRPGTLRVCCTYCREGGGATPPPISAQRKFRAARKFRALCAMRRYGRFRGPALFAPSSCVRRRSSL